MSAPYRRFAPVVPGERVIWKFPLAQPGTIKALGLGRSAKLLAFDLDPIGHACLWVDVDPGEADGPNEAAPVTHEVVLIGTGHPIPPAPWAYQGTVVAGPYVWHCYVHGPQG